MEHHANIVPWHMLAAERGIELRWVPLTDDGQLDLTDLAELLDGAKAFGFTAMSNVLGTITPVRQLCDAAHAAGALAIVDGCQYVPHNVTDVQAWDADFVAFSSHKMCGPSGIGVLWGREALLDAMPPFLGGGNMIADVRLDGFTPAELPAKFEAGTPPIVEAIGLGAAIDFLEGLGMANVRRHEMEIADLRDDHAHRALRRRHHHPRSDQRRGARRDVQLRLPRHPPARPVAGARPAQRLHARRPPLRQAADAAARRHRHGPRQLLPVQRRRRRRCAGRRTRRRQRIFGF